ncbi:MAG: YesL family protein [Lachnospiraceae bacterium]|nr:YesL family protein [Lachnospiraceae bacterium]
MSFFSVDGPLYRFLTTLWDVIKINFLWLICSLPIVTMGAATVAAFTVTNKMAEDREGYVGRQFIKAFKENLKQGIPLGLLFLFCCYVVYLDFELQRVTESMVVQVFGILACVVFISAFIYAFPLCARYENTLKNTLANSIQITIRYFPRTIALLLVLAVELLLFLFNSTTLFFLLLIGPACIIFTISGFAMYIFRRIESENGEKEADK